MLLILMQLIKTAACGKCLALTKCNLSLGTINSYRIDLHDAVKALQKISTLPGVPCHLCYKTSISNNLLFKHRFLTGGRNGHSTKLKFGKSVMLKIAVSTPIFSTFSKAETESVSQKTKLPE